MNRSKSGLLVLGSMSLLLTTSCFLSKAEGQIMANDIDRLRREIATLQRQGSDSEIVNQRKHDQIDGRLVSLEKFSFKRATTETNESDQLKKELADLRGQLEETQKNIETIKPAPAPAEVQEEAPVDKMGHFEWAKTAFSQKDYGAAFSRADSFIDKYKNDKTYGADAYVLKGDAAVMLAKAAAADAAKLELNKKALAAYQDFLTRFPKSPRIPEGLFKVGETMRNMGYSSDAKIFYEEIVQKHPKSDFVKQAKARLVDISQKKRAAPVVKR
jgi:TolA-binding protein